MGWAEARVRIRVSVVAAGLLIAGCTSSGPTVTISDDGWSANTIRVESSSRGVPLMITNTTNMDQTFLVINLWEGTVGDLPLTPEGLLDLTMANVSLDATRPASRFGLIHPEGVGDDGSLPVLLPGGTVKIIIGPSGGPNLGPYLVMSGEPHAVGTGRFAEFEIGAG